MLLTFLAALSLQAAQPNAQVTQDAPADRATQRVDDREQVVCRREHVVGSNRPQRVCLPRREWDELRDAAQDEHRRMDRPSGQTGNPVG